MLDILLPLLILGVLGILFGCLLGYASKKFAVEKDPLYINIREALPGANCGACGYAGCDAYAKAVAASEAAPNRCSVGGQAAADAIAQCLGVEAAAMERQIARVACKGGCAEAPDKAEYYGIADCREAAMTAGGEPRPAASAVSDWALVKRSVPLAPFMSITESPKPIRKNAPAAAPAPRPARVN